MKWLVTLVRVRGLLVAAVTAVLALLVALGLIGEEAAAWVRGFVLAIPLPGQ